MEKYKTGAEPTPTSTKIRDSALCRNRKNGKHRRQLGD